ncbi:probable salivary secreted peptide [Uranotaenia lowii]|uniref:probable salivary secreted peptide n=1 Tax=Uranotaenia lowii TaxID=190385 RepID=UPI00247AB2DC|nr:probable salivary secreted peptide [Uranotaenia lowii]
MKSLVVAAVVISLGALVFAQSHNQFWGFKGPYDTLLNRTIAVKSSSILQVKTLDLTYPVKGQLGRNITAIYAYDQITNGKGGYATLLSGGVGFNHTKIHLKSQRGNEFNFIVEIYGR